MIEKNKLKNIIFLVNLFILNIIYFSLHLQKFQSLIPSGVYLKLYLISILIWVLFSFYYDKYNLVIDYGSSVIFRKIFWSSTMSLLFIVISISFSDMWSVSRLFILSFMIFITFSELILIICFRYFLKNADIKIISSKNDRDDFIKKDFYLKWFIPSGVSLVIIYILTNYFYNGSFQYNLFQEKNFLILFLSWGLSTLLTNRYKTPVSINHYYEIAPYIKASILSLLIINFLYFILRIEYILIKELVNVLIIHSTFEIVTYFLYFSEKNKSNENQKINFKKIINLSISQKRLKIKKKVDTLKNSFQRSDLKQSLDQIKRKNIEDVINFIWDSIKSEKIDKNKLSIFNTGTSSNIKFLLNNSNNLIINVHKINDFRRINEYFLDVYSKLENDGIFIGNFIPLESMNKHLRSKMPHFLFIILFPFYFFFFRVFPKLAITKQIYFILTGGKNRILSRAEVLGRLSFCGYEVIEEKLIGYTSYFISRKINTISEEQYPSYGPIVKLKRIGFQGERIYIYKLRTMYPYSEFIQDHIYKKHNIDNSGKFKNDFRITAWGKIFRSFFVDEIPQIYNWLIGDVKLIGVRALSEQYFSLYPKHIQELRVKSKPGLVPPYYADMPNTLKEIVKSEETYLLKKEKNPFLTDIQYFTKAIYNILFRGARSK